MLPDVDFPEIDLTDPAVIRDPFTAYGRAREQSPLAKMEVPGIGSTWVVTRYHDARTLLADPRFTITSGSFVLPQGIPEHCRAYLRTMSEMDGPEHARLRRLVAPAFTPRRAVEFRTRIEPIVAGLLDALPAGEVDLIGDLLRPLPMDVICALVGVPDADRPAWRAHGAAIATGAGFAAAVPAIIDGARSAVAAHRAAPGGRVDDVLADLVRAAARRR